MTYTDTHCHIHDPEFFPAGGQPEYERAQAAEVKRLLCVGTSINSSKQALNFSYGREGVFATVGIHPHDATHLLSLFDEFRQWCVEHVTEKIVAIGEVGLDYYYMNSPRQLQLELLEKHIDLALSLGLPLAFHVREAFDDFWSVLNNFTGVRGVLHSFTDNIPNMEKGLSAGLYVGVNGIATFARDRDDVTRAIPLEKLLLETDAPFLTPVPNRGKINEPENVPLIASFVAELRGVSVEALSRATEQNVNRLFF